MNINYNFDKFRYKCYEILYYSNNNNYNYNYNEYQQLIQDILLNINNSNELLYQNINHSEYKNIINYLNINENFENDFKIEYTEIRKTIILFAFYGLKFINVYNYHINKINDCINFNYNYIDITNLQIYMNSLYYYIENEKNNGFLFSKIYNSNFITILDLVVYYLSKYSDILYNIDSQNIESTESIDNIDNIDNIDINECSESSENSEDNKNIDNRMNLLINELDVLNNLFETFGCDLDINNYFNNIYNSIYKSNLKNTI
jgi:hypothetical protein